MSDSESSTTDLSKIRKDYLKLSKAKLTKQCKALHLDPYGTKAVLVDILMKEHRKKLQINKSPKHSAKHIKRKIISSSPRYKPYNPSKRPKSAIKLNNKGDRSKSHDQLPSLPIKGVRPNAYLTRTLYPRKRRSHSTYLSRKPSKLVNRNKNKLYNRRSSTDLIPIKDKKHLIKLSKMDLIKQCKLQNININGLRNRNDIINKIVNIEELFKEKERLNANKQRKRDKKKSKSEVISPLSDMVISESLPINMVLSPLEDVDIDEKKDIECNTNDIGLWMNEECDFGECISRKRLIQSLKEYEEKYDANGDKEDINMRMKGFIENNKYVLNDWHHIVYIHFESNIRINHDNFNVLYDDIKKYHLLCDIGECSYYLRNNKNREKEDVYHDDIDLNYQFMMNVLDNIHCYLVHSFDTGFRMRNRYEFDTKKKDDKDDVKYLYYDEEMEGFAAYFEKKRMELQRVRGMEGMKSNRYSTYVES